MPAIHPGSKILVSGASGFIAVHIIKALLEKGYHVRGTVRSAVKGDYLARLFEEHGRRFEYVIVEDIGKDGAFDEAVRGVVAIEHTASPVNYQIQDPQELIRPALDGTLGILKSTLKNGSTVNRIVITSSCAAVFTVQSTPRVFSEEDWNFDAVERVNSLGKEVTAREAYRAAKVLAEKAAWDFWNEHKSSVNWDLVVLNPPFVFGPPLQDLSSPDALNSSLNEWYRAVLTENRGDKTLEDLVTRSGDWVDVRDLAEAHTIALQREELSGERVLISAGSFYWQDWIDIASSLHPSPIPFHSIPPGNPTGKRPETYLIQYNLDKQEKLLGIRFRSKEECARDMLVDFERRGWRY